MDFTYRLMNGESEIVSYKLNRDRTDVLVKHLYGDQDAAGTLRIVVLDGDEEIFILPGVTRMEGLLLLELIKDSAAHSSESNHENVQPITKGRRRSIKWFTGAFMAFGILSFAVKLKDYSKAGGGINIFNSIVTLLLIILLCIGMWHFFIRKNKIKQTEKQA